LVIIHDEPSTPELANRLIEQGVILAEGQTVEICLGLPDWAGMVSDALEAGFVLTVDYGKEAEELYSNELRPRGTLTTFYRHTQTDAPLRRIGYQDITSQVDFTAVMNEGRKFGLQTLGYSTQKEFLHNLGIQRWQRGLTSLGLPQGQTEANRAGMVDLIRPGGLGDFKVLVQAKGISNTALWGFQSGEQEHEQDALLNSIPPPLMTPEHLDIRQSWNPSGEIQMEEFWPPFTALGGKEEGQP
jgi:SAM-dependent MidA family methyltransferase